MDDNSNSRFGSIIRTAAQCVKLAAGLTSAGLMGVILFLVMIHLCDTHPRVYYGLLGMAGIAAFIGLTVVLASHSEDSGKEGLA